MHAQGGVADHPQNARTPLRPRDDVVRVSPSTKRDRCRYYLYALRHRRRPRLRFVEVRWGSIVWLLCNRAKISKIQNRAIRSLNPVELRRGGGSSRAARTFNDPLISASTSLDRHSTVEAHHINRLWPPSDFVRVFILRAANTLAT